MILGVSASFCASLKTLEQVNSKYYIHTEYLVNFDTYEQIKDTFKAHSDAYDTMQLASDLVL